MGEFLPLAILEFELRNLHQLATFQSRLMRDNALNRHIERQGDIHERFAVL